MEPIAVIEGTAVPLDRSDVDTDQIIPAQYLKRIERTGFGPFLFDEWRKDPDFVLNDERYRGASILIAGANFGSTVLPLTTSEPVWKSSPCTSAVPATCEARTTTRWSIRSLAPKVLRKAVRGVISASTPELAVCVMSLIAVRIWSVWT